MTRSLRSNMGATVCQRGYFTQIEVREHNSGMAINDILCQIDSEIQHLTQARALLAGTDAANGGGRSGTRRNLSPEARARIAAAQKRRWAKQRKAQSE